MTKAKKKRKIKVQKAWKDTTKMSVIWVLELQVFGFVFLLSIVYNE